MEIKFLKVPVNEKRYKYRCNYKVITWEVEPIRNEYGTAKWIVRDSLGIADKDLVFKSRWEAKKYLIEKTDKFYKH